VYPDKKVDYFNYTPSGNIWTISNQAVFTAKPYRSSLACNWKAENYPEPSDLVVERSEV